jgi:hypothetical protein
LKRVEDFHTEFAEGYSSERGDEFWGCPPGQVIKQIKSARAANKHLEKQRRSTTCSAHLTNIGVQMTLTQQMTPILVTPEPSIHDAPLFYYPRLISSLARSSARRVVEQRMRDEGARLSLTPIQIIMQEADEYLKSHPELVQQAIDRVRNDPRFRTLAEKEARDRARKRKREMKRR